MSISSIDLNLLAVLHAVLETRNVARAAERLHVTPSAVSNALARLRHVLADPLVTRRGRGIVPTPRALELAPVLARVLQDLESALASSPFDPGSSNRTFTLAVADVGQTVWGPRLVAALRRELPNARLRLVGIEGMLSLGDLASAEVDLHVGLAAEGPGIHAEALFEEPSVLVARRGHPAARRALTARRLGELQHVRVEMVPSKNFRDHFAATFTRARVAREVVVTVPSFHAAAEVVAATDLVTMLPASLLRAPETRHRLVALRAPLPPHRTRFAMNWHERTHRDLACVAFRDLVRRVVVESAAAA